MLIDLSRQRLACTAILDQNSKYDESKFFFEGSPCDKEGTAVPPDIVQRLEIACDGRNGLGRVSQTLILRIAGLPLPVSLGPLWTFSSLLRGTLCGLRPTKATKRTDRESPATTK